MVDTLVEAVVNLYKEDVPVKQISQRLKISFTKTRKILISYAAYPCAKAQQIATLQQQGKSLDEIAVELNMPRSNVLNYTPYTRGMKNAENPTQNALKIRKCRAKKRGQQSE